MLYIIENFTDPYWNLAAEEYCLKHFKEPVFRLWRNDNAIIVGRYQNTLAEVDIDFVKTNNIKVVRRLTGGGAVFHDLGNINFTFIEEVQEREESSAMFKRFTAPILAALNSLGINAYLEGRNDLLIDGKKFSGNAVCLYKDRILQHGTLLYSASMANLSSALKTRPEKFIGKAVQSNISRVTNISSWLTNKMDILDFKGYLANFICNKYSDITRYDYTADDIAAINYLKESKYATDSWNFGASPAYKFEKVKKLPCGIVELYFSVANGYIKDLEIYGDYFFSKPTEEFIKKIIGTKEIPVMTSHSKEALNECFSRVNINDYFHGITQEDIVEMFF